MIKSFIMKFIKPSQLNLEQNMKSEMTISVTEPEQSKKEENKPSLQVKVVHLGSVVKDLEQPPAPPPVVQVPVVEEPVQVPVVTPAPKPKRQSKKKETLKVSKKKQTTKKT
jgi:hypothetical protein